MQSMINNELEVKLECLHVLNKMLMNPFRVLQDSTKTETPECVMNTNKKRIEHVMQKL